MAVLLAGCSSASSRDLQYIKQARSVGAEWALINEQAAHEKLTPTYVASMHAWLRQQLRTAFTSLLEPDSRYGEEIRALLAEPPDAPPARLQRHANVLKQIEKSLESA